LGGLVMQGIVSGILLVAAFAAVMVAAAALSVRLLRVARGEEPHV
jgi:Na+/proline symporter